MKKYTCKKCGAAFELDHAPVECPDCRRVAKREALKNKLDEGVPPASDDLIENENAIKGDDDSEDEFDFPDIATESILFTDSSDDDSLNFDSVSELDENKESEQSPAADERSKTIDHNKSNTVRDDHEGSSLPVDIKTLTGTDPLATLGSGSKLGTDSALIKTTRFGDPANADSVGEFDVYAAPTILDVTSPKDSSSSPPDSSHPPEALNPTIQDSKIEPAKTVVNPNAAQEAALTYSDGLNTIIPPRTVSRFEESGKLQDYKVEKRLGSGAFGIVFQAIQVPLDRKVAVKVLQVDQDSPKKRKDKLKNEFLREAQFTGRLEHPNIVPIHDIGLTVNENGHVSPFYVMKQIRGKSWLSTIRGNSRPANLEIFKRVTNAIGFAHAKNILHCDLKPDNVMLGEFGEVLVVDWGQAIDLAEPSTIRPGGTPAYISPEMAKYWCDIYLDRRSESPAQKLVGFRSDVYLLGALLFEIVAGKPPHLGDVNSSPYDTILGAAQNDICDYSKFANDELMQIALTALRKIDGKSIDTVQELLEAIESYEDRRSSIELRRRAEEVLATAKNDGDYDAFQRARFGFEESLEKWQGNEASELGLRNAQVSCAELALKDQNFDLGIGMLEHPQSQSERQLKQELLDGKTKRDRRKKLVRWLALGLASSIVVGIGLNAFMIDRNLKTIALKNEALVLKANADIETKKAIQEKEKLSVEIVKNEDKIKKFPAMLIAEEAKFNTQLQVAQQQLANDLENEQKRLDQKLKLEQQKLDQELIAEQDKLALRLKDKQRQFEDKLVEEKVKYDQQTAGLVKQKDQLSQQISTLNESSKLLRYKSRLTNVIQRLQTGDFQESRRLLDEFEDQSPWELQRLNLLAHREIEAIFPNKELITFTASKDGERFALVFDKVVEVRNTSDFNTALVRLPIEEATAVALSADGQKIAVAKPADSPLKPGSIWIVDLSEPASPNIERKISAQSQSITKINFSANGTHFLSVGSPSRIRKSSGGLEEELMVWDRSWEPVDVRLTGRNGSLTKFENAEFSSDGRRILTTNPNGITKDLKAHVFEFSGDKYQWSTESPISGINTATFADDSGSEVIVCYRDNELGTHLLATWDISGPSERAAEFVNASNAPVAGNFQVVDQLEEKALSIVRSADWVLTSGQDKKATLWDWTTKTRKSFGGHSRDVDFCALIPGKTLEQNVLLSVATGFNPEILKNDLALFQAEVQTRQMGRIGRNDQPSPTTYNYSQISDQSAFGNDLGQASVVRMGRRIQWDISAWKQHVLSDQFLFAQSRGDYFYKINRQSGAIEKVLTKLSGASSDDLSTIGEIIQFEVSDDGRVALVVNDDDRPEFHLWNLETQSKIRTVNIGEEDVFGTGADKGLVILRLSPNGRWVVGGKVGLFAWSTETGQRKNMTQSSPEMARTSISSISFVGGGSGFIASWKDRLDLFDLAGTQPSRRFNTSRVFYNKNEPSVLDTDSTGKQIRILARSTGKEGGVVLLDLSSDTELARFPNAIHASFSKSVSGDVLIANKLGSDSLVSRWTASSRQIVPLSIEQAFSNQITGTFRNIERVFESADGTLTLQTSTKNQINSLRRDWNTISLDANFKLGPLRVFAKPRLDYVAAAGDQAITFDHGTIRFWRLNERSVQPNGIFDSFCRLCELAPNEKTLLVVTEDSSFVIGIDPQDSSVRFRVSLQDGPSVESVAWNSNSNKFALGFETGNVKVYEVDSLQGSASAIASIDLANAAINKICFAAESDSMIAFSKTGTAYVSNETYSQGSSVAINHSDGQKILTGDISPDGKRAVTGSDKGRITIWNSEAAQDVIEDETQNAKKNVERELLTLQNNHQSAINFAKFHQINDGQLQIYSAEANAGENQYLIWSGQAPE